jgi:hypothetical protein
MCQKFDMTRNLKKFCKTFWNYTRPNLCTSKSLPFSHGAGYCSVLYCSRNTVHNTSVFSSILDAMSFSLWFFFPAFSPARGFLLVFLIKVRSNFYFLKRSRTTKINYKGSYLRQVVQRNFYFVFYKMF